MVSAPRWSLRVPDPAICILVQGVRAIGLCASAADTWLRAPHADIAAVSCLTTGKNTVRTQTDTWLPVPRADIATVSYLKTGKNTVRTPAEIDTGMCWVRPPEQAEESWGRSQKIFERNIIYSKPYAGRICKNSTKKAKQKCWFCTSRASASLRTGLSPQLIFKIKIEVS